MCFGSGQMIAPAVRSVLHVSAVKGGDNKAHGGTTAPKLQSAGDQFNRLRLNALLGRARRAPRPGSMSWAALALRAPR
jgi:hypothetical protein